ncbi:MAG: DUF4363 family protein [Clostridia bacterium]|nr:DUF4363 family protein [Clostridia bacterium]
MAKQIIIFVASLALLIFGGLWEIKYLNETSRYLQTDIDYVRYEVENDNFDGAKEQIEELKRTWNNVSDVWDIFVNHDRIDDIEEAFENLKADVELKDKNSSIKSSMVLKSIVSQIVDKHKFSFKHIF